MVRSDFERQMTIDKPPGELWSQLRDPVVLEDCTTFVKDILETSPGEWSAKLTARVGQFTVAAPISVWITEEEEPTYIAVRASGEDRLVGTRLAVDAGVEVSENDKGSTLALRGSYEVTGRVANLGGAVVRNQATTMIDEFWQSLERTLRR